MEEATEKSRAEDWLKKLRKQFVRIATRRVDKDDMEDVVQEAMRVVAQKGIAGTLEETSELPQLAWCFQVLRYTIGNHYRRAKTRRQWLVSGYAAAADGNMSMHRPIEEMGSTETLIVIESALAEMNRDHPQCGRYLARMIEGVRPQELAVEERIESAVFYRRLYRCRKKLRDRLAAKGVVV